MKTNARFALVLSALLTTACTACAPPSVESLPPTETQTGLEVDAVPGAAKSEFDVYDATGKKVAGNQSADSVLALPAGRYTITRALLLHYVWATNLEVVPDQVTHLAMGAIRVDMVPGAAHGNFTTWTTAGDELVQRDDPDLIVTAPPATYRITDELNASWIWADSLDVTAGQIRDVRLGAVRISVPASTNDQYFSVYDSAKSKRVKDELNLETLESMPAGRFALTRYLDGSMDYAAVNILPGEVTDVTLGAIRWNGAQTVDVYDASGMKKLCDALHPATQIAAAPSTYLFKRNGAAVSTATVAEGQVTTAQ